MANYYSAQAYLSKTVSDLGIAKSQANHLKESTDVKSIKIESDVLIKSLDKLTISLSSAVEQSADYSMFRICEPDRSEELCRASFIYGVVRNVNTTLERACQLSKSISPNNEKLSIALIEKNVSEALYAVNVISKVQASSRAEEIDKQTPASTPAELYFDELDETLSRAECAAGNASKSDRLRILDHAHNVRIWRKLIDDELERLSESVADSSNASDETK